jgi:uncharacterized metal-binding protein YceD (DUF177 family)
MYDNFIINLEGLKIGKHNFKFLLDNTFFESLEYSIIEGGNTEVELSFNKKESFYDLTFKYKGYIDNICHRCGDDFKFPISFEISTLLKHGEEEHQDEGMWIIDKNCVNLDLRHYLYESLCLLLPSKIMHKTEDDCNQDLLKKLSEYSSNVKNEKTADPRWDALNKLKKN